MTKKILAINFVSENIFKSKCWQVLYLLPMRLMRSFGYEKYEKIKLLTLFKH